MSEARRGGQRQSSERSERPKPQPPGSALRKSALGALTTIVQDNKALGDTAFSGLAPRDAALARRIVMECLRRHRDYDALLEQLLSKGLSPRDGAFRLVLWIGLTQVLVMDVPDHAAVSTTMALLDDRPKNKGRRGMVNAILRRIIRERDYWTQELDGVGLGFVPDWMGLRWFRYRSEETMGDLIDALAQEPATDLSLKPGVDTSALAEALNAAVLPGDRLRLPLGSGAIPDLAGFDDGDWWVQDFAASLPVELFGDVTGKTVLDLCAAPGGKTAQLAAKGATVTAVDSDQKRLERVKINLQRLQLKAKLIRSNALNLPDSWRDSFDCVLLDAPCSATGTLRRHPDLPWLRSVQSLLQNRNLQLDMLKAAAACLKPGGTLVYAVCSLEQEERLTEDDLPPGLRFDDVTGAEIFGLDQLIEKGAVVTAPYDSPSADAVPGMDGFYAVRLIKTA